MEPHPTPDRALRPVETQPGVLVHPAADRRLATEHWLLATAPTPEARSEARLFWKAYGTAALRLGTLFSAVRIPGHLVHAVAGCEYAEDKFHEHAQHVDEFLDQALDGGPVICDPRYRRYYALVPASMPTTWRLANDDWRVMDVDCLGRGCALGVPKVDAVDFNPATWDSYWSVPMSSPGALCAGLDVARLIAAARHQVAEPDA
ncbi:hypothetical protein ABZ723_15895 [Streptomyces sp. NPDC006700]|uniref:hypothetical protein n=1 Tax=Streptomyces sp. NPDC006700 TaxID=3154479 RepID=UPI0033F0E457